MTKKITIYSITFSDNGEIEYFKGIDDLRDFAIDRIDCGWETETTKEDLQDDEKVIDFLNNDYCEKVNIVFTITENDLKYLTI